MTSESARPHPEQVAAFFQKHRTGLVTLVFTDLADSTALLHQLGDQAGATFLRRRRQILREVLHSLPEAEEIETAGDSFLLVFAKPSDAVRFALQSQARLRTFSLESGLKVQERMGIHLGEVVISEFETEVKAKDLYGIQLAACARVMSLAVGGQVLLTRGAFDSARQVLKGEDIPGVGGLRWVSHGPYLLKGIEEPVEVCEVAESGETELLAPKTSEKAQRQVRADEEPVLGWRPAVGGAVPNTRWVLEKKLGEGGFGEVWLGRHQTMKERRVFKFCFRADRVRSLKREMTLFRLIKERIGDHPHIVSLREVYFDGPPYYVEMDYVEGEDLAGWCAGQGGVEKVALETKLEIVAQVAEALQAAHDAGVIHRDVKPANILVSDLRFAICDLKKDSKPGPLSPSERTSPATDPNHAAAQSQFPNQRSPIHAPQSQIANQNSPIKAKLTDFGIGQVVSEEYLGGITRAGFTQTMMADSSSSKTGTQLYMAPELLAGKPASIRSDIYSLGVVLYQLLVGDFMRPLTTDWAQEIADPLLQEDLRHCFAGNPQERFAGAGQLAKHLRALPERRMELARREAEKAALERTAYRRGMMRMASVAAVILLVIAGLAAVALNQSGRAKTEAAKATQAAAAEMQQRQAAQRSLYAAKMNLAQQAWERNNVGRVRELLEETATNAERGFEWYYWQRQTHLELFTLKGHGASVQAVAFSPDGRQLVTGSWDDAGKVSGTAKVWDAATGEELLSLKGHSSGIFSVAYSPDGRRMVTGSWDSTARVWEAATGKELLAVKGHRGLVWSAAFSPDGQRIVTGGADGTARLWDAVSGKELLTLKGHDGGVSSVVFSRDGQRIVTGCWDGTAKVWDAASGKDLLTLKGHVAPIRLAISPDGKRIVTGSYDHTAKVWDAATGKELLILKGHSDGIPSVAFSPDGRRILTGSHDQTAKVWDAASGQELFTLKGHSAAVRAAAFSPDGRRIITGSWDKTAKVWDANSGEEPTLRGHGGRVRSVVFSPDGKRVATGSYDQTARVWEVLSGKEVLTFTGHAALIRAVAFSPDGQRMATAGGDGTSKVWAVATGKQLATLQGHGHWVNSVAFSPDGQRIVTSSHDHTAKVWEAATGRELHTLRGHSGAVASAVFSPDGRWIATGSADGTVKVWDAGTAKERLTLKGHRDWVNCVAFSPNGRLIAAASWDWTARVWEAATGKELVSLKGHSDGLSSVAFSPDSQRIATGSGDRTAKVWDAVSGKELISLNGHGDVVASVAFAPDGQRIVTGSWDRTAKVWEAATAGQTADWQREEQAADERVQRELTATAEHERILQAQDPGAIKQWLVLLPLPHEAQSSIEALKREQIPHEASLRPRAGERVMASRNERIWMAVQLKDYVLSFTELLGEMADDSVAYAVCYIQSEAVRTGLIVKVGSDNASKVYLNEREIYQSEDGPYVTDQHVTTGLQLNAGLNILVFKVVNGARWLGSVRFTDAAGQPVKGLHVTLTPP